VRTARAIGLLAAVVLAVSDARADDLVIRGVLLVDGSGAPPRANVDIAIAGGRIRAIAPGGTLPANGRVIDGAGLAALPGLIDAHVHFVAAAGSAYRHDTDATVRDLARHHLRAYVACGVTTVLDAAHTPRWCATSSRGSPPGIPARAT
jgi:dihydroorotase-like cyclic amidohydrolase